MIRKHESPVAVRAGVMSVLVHGILLLIMLVSLNWKSEKPASVAEVELWDSIPSAQVPPPKPLPPPEPPKPEPKEEIKPEPKPEPPPEPKPEPKAEIQVKKEPIKKPEIEKPVEKEKPKPDPAIKEAEIKRQKELERKKQEEALKKLQEEMLADEDNSLNQAQEKAAAEARAAQAAAASVGEVNKYKALIQNKIRRHVNRQLCGSGKPELEFGIAMMPTGEVAGTPRLIKSSGMEACDEAVSRAIMQAQPLPLPPDPALFSQFRDLNLKFRPNDDN